jgi:hypothetical protein
MAGLGVFGVIVPTYSSGYFHRGLSWESFLGGSGECYSRQACYFYLVNGWRTKSERAVVNREGTGKAGRVIR